MEQQQMPELIWMEEPTPSCLACDGTHLQQLGIVPLPEGYPVPSRYTAEDLEPPRHPLSTYRALMTSARRWRSDALRP